jgi:hypothetical protein
MSERCPCCGATIKTYTHNLNRGLLSALWKLYQKKEYSSKLKDMDITYNQRANFQKLKYWGLVEKHSTGIWSMTYAGVEFIQGRKEIPSHVRSFHGEFNDFPEIAHLVKFDIDAVDPMYKKRVEYANEQG